MNGQHTAEVDRRSATTICPQWRPSVVALGWQRTKIEIAILSQDYLSLFLVLFFPALLMLLFGMIFDDMPPLPGPDGQSLSVAQTYLPGLLAVGTVLSGFQNLTGYVAVDRFNGTIRRLSSTPLPEVSYFLGKIGMTLVLVVAQSVLLLLVATLVFDVPLPADPMRWVVIAGVMLLSTAAGAVLGIALASAAKTEQAGTTLAVAPTMVLSFISGVYMLPSLLPDWLLGISAIFPLRWTAVGLQYAFLPEWAFEIPEMKTADPWLGIGIIAAWFVLGLILAMKTFKWKPKDS
ncbi:Inner membrane transport permease yadH [Brevibacterium casei]|uniref:Transport permease protein n=1 Tax=Brevibacterium casei TaxID=33889 RepID=A0A269ZIP8_9MICO|nr:MULTISPECIES: ABC transporter permease [Brevibacterium]MCM1013155.1 ABC transporter permease [Brevibacterium sp. XM4083]PAK97350.1 hypothetical protein B8X04_01870 [Brevibacterium casei]QPS34580.1 ABC transporter permease [Brevibacterium casei]VEW10903.1 Inner membrane transport permease yadH [Brevibacterium casei]